MVVLIAKQALNTEFFTKINSSWKNGVGSVKVDQNGSLWYKITDIRAKTADQFQKIVESPIKLFKGDDTFTGSGSADKLNSFAGNDVVEARGGADVVLGGDGEDRLFGEGGDDDVRGGAGSDVISGGEGLNLLTGNAGKDSFLFDAPLTGGNAPFKQGNTSTITDFTVGTDIIQLDRSVFKDIGPKGNLPRSSFSDYSDSTGAIRDHSIIYDKASGEIWYSKNGSVVDAVLFARVGVGTELTQKDFLIV